VGDVVDVRGRDMRQQRHPARASVTMWCLDSALRRSVGFGPVFSPCIAQTDRCPPPSSVGRAAPVGAARRGSSHASDARRRPVLTSPSVASTCCLSRIPRDQSQVLKRAPFGFHNAVFRLSVAVVCRSEKGCYSTFLAAL
jgi:hypothetical protein